MTELICRFCMSEESNMISVHEEERNIAEKAKVCLNIEVNRFFTKKNSKC